MGDRPTPRSIGVCALIALRSDPSSPLHEIDFNPHEQDKMTVLLEESVLSSVACLSSWMQRLRDVVSVEVAELLLDCLYMASESVDSLLDLMDSLCAAAAEGLVDAVSVHGVYLRRVCLGFEQLSFESVTLLWQELCDQLDRTPDMRDQELDEKVESSSAAIYQDENLSCPLSLSQVDDMLQQNCRQLDETYFSFEQVELQVRSVLKKAPEAPVSYFLRFLNCLRHKDRAALEALHQFFDHSMIQKQTATKEVLQFSAILLALVHDSFGDPALALMATEEAVRVAQQSKDKACVAFALGELFQNRGNLMPGRRELLNRCAKRAAQEQVRSLVIGSSLGLSLDYLEDENRDPATVWKYHLEATSEPTADTMPGWDRPTCLSSSPRETCKGLFKQSLVEAAIWNSFGSPALSALASVVALNCYPTATSEEKMSALANFSRLSHHGIPSFLLSPSPDFGRHESLKFQQPEDYQRSAGRSFPESHLSSLLLHLHGRCLNERSLDVAKVLEDILRTSLPPGSSCRDKLVVDVGIQACARLCHSQNWSKARALAAQLALSPDLKRGDRIKLLLVIANIEDESVDCGFLGGLPPLLDVISVSEKTRLHELLTMASLMLARLFLRMKNPYRALSILKAATPYLLQSSNMSFQAEAYLTQAKSHIQLAEDAPTPSPRKKSYQSALLELGTSERLSRQCQNHRFLVEVYYLKARVHFLLGNTQECELASEQYMFLQEVKHSTTSPVWSLTQIASSVSCY